ncbi:MAG: NAD(P)-binding domain-containing protein, partial [Gammaproteobacteria bacterium]|nr:NAD(P)-binding domain-containing protein [Gammaproteobacteria bacterium]
MKICIYGAGAVGSHFAARLANAEHEVSVVARGPHLEAIQRNGITLRSGDQTIQARVTATDRPTQLGTQDLVIVTVKAPALAGIVDGVKQLLDAQTPLIFGMNGIPWWYFHGL